MSKLKGSLPLFIILILAFSLRLYGINWDEGFHLHPDERMLLIVADKISFFKNLNPDFFNYGSLPIYLLKGTAQLGDWLFKTNQANYDGMLELGRYFSIAFDLLTIVIIHKICLLLFPKFGEKIGLVSSFVYAIIFFPIQNTHFFVTDVPLNTLISLLSYLLVSSFLKKKLQSKDNTTPLFAISIVFAALIAVKITALVFLPLIVLMIILESKHKILDFFFFLTSFLLIYFLFSPYNFINSAEFLEEIGVQLKMNSDPYVFPYTLQYVNTLPYLYYLKNIFLWGLGPILSILSLYGLYGIVKKIRFDFLKNVVLFFMIFYFYYFIIIGRSAVKFMRYMLPMYPFFAILSGYALMDLRHKFPKYGKILVMVIFFAAFFWSNLFINTYSQIHTRIAADIWIGKNIPKKSTIAVEHWDDRLPLINSKKYKIIELALYERPDNSTKWKKIRKQLSGASYIIIASNRLYTPLQKLSDCQRNKYCYPETAKYYHNLFSGKSIFKKVAEFTNYPKIEIGNFKMELPDDSADESFTVYDHPKIMIFKKN